MNEQNRQEIDALRTSLARSNALLLIERLRAAVSREDFSAATLQQVIAKVMSDDERR
jgi:hypothetical protein